MLLAIPVFKHNMLCCLVSINVVIVVVIVVTGVPLASRATGAKLSTVAL